ncbi:SMEK domain-containing protein [Empedobacter brevis]|uniref:SMEK domain-containing protein n=1 Tax=Empedobacter brevis TaxID=247 RepID=UPI0039AF16AD
MKRELYIKEIIEELSILKTKIELLSGVNLNDINILSEYHIQEILNIIYDLNLRNANIAKSNVVAIDLEDKVNSIAVQVTANNRKTKIQETINKFLDNGLNDKYSTLIIFILGQKLKKYDNLNIRELHFIKEEHIIDFSSIVSKLTLLPLSKIEKIHKIFKSDKLSVNNSNSVTKFKKRQRIKALIEKNLIRSDLDKFDWEIIYYCPYNKFKYDRLIIRSIEDTAYPNIDDDESHPISTWFKTEIHDLYEYGIEIMLPMTYEIIVDKECKWNFFEDDRNRESISAGYKIERAHILQRIPYECIIKLDMSPDDIYGYPTLFVEYHNQRHYSEEIPFLLGYYHDKDNYRKCYYFELSDRNTDL